MGEDGGAADQTAPPARVGVPYTPSAELPVTEWSAAVYEEFQGWSPARGGSWERWDPSYLVLTISNYEGAAVEPVLIDTYEGELTITFGHWEAHLPDDGIYDDTDSHRAATAAKQLALDWLEGRVATAIYFNADDKWCGSKLLETPEDKSTLADTAWIQDFGPVRVEVRKANRSDWEEFRLSDGKLSKPS